MSDDQQAPKDSTTAESEASMIAMSAELAKEQNITAWVSIDLEKMRQASPEAQVDAVIASAAAIRRNLVKELHKNGIHVKQRLLRKLDRR